MTAANASAPIREGTDDRASNGAQGPPTTNNSTPNDTPQGRTFAEVLRRKESTTPSKVTLRTPLPNADKVQELLDYESQSDCDVDKLAEMMLDANHHAKITPVGVVWFETGSDLAQRSQTAIAQQLFSVNKNEAWAPWLPAITGTKKARNGQLILSVGTYEAQSAISQLTLKLFGKEYGISKPAVKKRSQVLDEYFFLDIAGVDADFDFKQATKGFFLLKFRPLLHLFTNVVPDTAYTFSSNVLRFYFCSTTMPTDLVVDSKVANHIQLENKSYPIFPKGHKSATAKTGNNSRQEIVCFNLDEVLQSAVLVEGQTPPKRQCVVLGEDNESKDLSQPQNSPPDEGADSQTPKDKEFQDAKKTVKRKTPSKASLSQSGIPTNMYEALRDINIGWTRLHNSKWRPTSSVYS
ncbi:hypothetical protein AeMF1_015126 [Aphanomyces euteiches]|nr:hypothetical protein AeMF1_015126 [Aphanomyces euteiches]